jgi:hypothetical protein
VTGLDVPTTLVAHRGDLPCWYSTATGQARRRLARRLARQGQAVLLWCPGGHRTVWDVVVTLSPLRHVTLDLSGPSLAMTRLHQVRPTGSRLGDALAVAQALDVDAAGRRAFGAARGVVTAVVDDLPPTIPGDDRRAWALLQLTRLLFLRFVESEGWLDGRKDFLSHVVDDTLSRGCDPWRDLLAPLFFGTLNRPPQRRTASALRFGRVPFLNGGLFEPHPLEGRFARWALPPDRWQALFELTIDRIEVSLDETDTGDRVTPDMMGRILEGLMDPVERAEGGVFYTPPRLVERVVTSALTIHLAARTGGTTEHLQQRLAAGDPSLRPLLATLRILDPAVGSGAFLIGALRVLTTGRPTDSHYLRHLLTHSLHGIDRHPAAVRITELRLWLALLRSMRGLPPHRIRPLPNLDTAVRVGDALLDPLSGQRIPDAMHARLRRARAAVQTVHGRAHHRAQAALRQVEHEALLCGLRSREQSLAHAVADRQDAASSRGLFGDAGSVPSGEPVATAKLSAQLALVRRRLDRLRRDGPGATFALEAAWAPVLAGGGFDLVIGNPPWVRAERLERAQREALAGRYRWWRGSGPGWRHEPDLAVAFVERALEVVRPGGTIAFVLPAKLATAGYATTARAGLVRETTLHVVADLQHDPHAAFAATTYPLAVIATRRPPGTRHVVQTGLPPDHGTTIPQQAWVGQRRWALDAPEVAALARRLRREHPMLGTLVQPSLGVKTGANAIFLDPPARLLPWTRPAIRGRDFREGTVQPSTRLLWTVDPEGRTLARLPEPVLDYLAPHEAHLRRRADFRTGPWWQLFRIRPSIARWRVAWPDIARGLSAVALHATDSVPLNTCYVATVSGQTAMQRLAAWLGTPTIRGLARASADPAASQHARFGARVVADLPCPAIVWSDERFGRLAADHDDAACATWADTALGLSERERDAIAAITTDRR